MLFEEQRERRVPRLDVTLSMKMNHKTKQNKKLYSLATSIVCLGSNAPEFGRTQYFLGAVVFILNKIFLSVGLVNRIYDITDTLNGPETQNKNLN